MAKIAAHRPDSLSNESGQAMTEYILLLLLVASLFILVRDKIAQFDLFSKLNSPLQGTFANAYQYGHQQGKDKHPRIPSSNGAVRIFYVRNRN